MSFRGEAEGREPGIHNPRPVVMDSGLAAARRPGMTGSVTVHLSWSATLSSAALTQASSFSPPGAPETPAAPMTSSPTLIGKAPRAVVNPVRNWAPICGFCFNRSSISPDGMRNVREVKAFLKLFSIVCGPVPSPRTCASTSRCGQPP